MQPISRPRSTNGSHPARAQTTFASAVAGRGETVVAVGHQPDCSEIFLELTGESRPFAPGAVAVVEL